MSEQQRVEVANREEHGKLERVNKGRRDREEGEMKVIRWDREDRREGNWGRGAGKRWRGLENRKESVGWAIELSEQKGKEMEREW